MELIIVGVFGLLNVSRFLWLVQLLPVDSPDLKLRIREGLRAVNKLWHSWLHQSSVVHEGTGGQVKYSRSIVSLLWLLPFSHFQTVNSQPSSPWLLGTSDNARKAYWFLMGFRRGGGGAGGGGLNRGHGVPSLWSPFVLFSTILYIHRKSVNHPPPHTHTHNLAPSTPLWDAALRFLGQLSTALDTLHVIGTFLLAWISF